MDYIELLCTIEPYVEERAEIMIARLAQRGFESFFDADTGFLAYIPVVDFDESILGDKSLQSVLDSKVSFDYKVIEERNWNEEWESSFKPVVVADRCMVRAPFHEIDPSVKYDIVIEPQMSFGTAHHETTHMMIEMLLNEDLAEKDVLDMGCGTGILAILAHKLGAVKIVAIDNDEWAYNNTLSNLIKNNTEDIVVLFGDASLLKNDKFDLIVANINRNVLLKDISKYSESLDDKGCLILSGFYKDDLRLITEEAAKHSLEFDSHLTRNDWVAAKYKRAYAG